jgi:hypothetical protein
MKKTSKAVLLSLLVFPGAGHIFLKKYLPASGFIVVFAYLLSIVIKKLIERSEEISQMIISGEIPLEINAISQALNEQSANAGAQMGFSGYALLFIWLFATFDAYRLAKQIK